MRTIGALIFPGFEVLDLFGPLEMFGMLPEEYEIRLVAERSGAVVSNQQVTAMADLSFADGTGFDILLVPGGTGTRTEVDNRALLTWLRDTAENADYVLSVCTGSVLLAKAGLLDGRRATTNKAAFDWVAKQASNTTWVRQARWVEDGTIFTSSGVSAGMDMSLAAIAQMHDRATAVEVAKWAEYEWHSDPDWDPFAKIHGLV